MSLHHSFIFTDKKCVNFIAKKYGKARKVALQHQVGKHENIKSKNKLNPSQH